MIGLQQCLSQKRNKIMRILPLLLEFIINKLKIIFQLIIPSITKNEKHPNLRHLLSLYYVIHSALSIVIILIWVFVAIKMNYNFRCEPLHYSDSFYSKLVSINEEYRCKTYNAILSDFSDNFDVRNIFVVQIFGNVGNIFAGYC